MKNSLRRFRDLLDKYSLLPNFTEDTIFLMVIALGIIYFVDPSAQVEIYDTLRYSEKATLIAGAGAVFTIYTAFFTHFKTETQKHYMLWFALIVNLVVGITTINHLNEQGVAQLWYIFPALNIATFFLVLVFWYTGLYNTGRLVTKSNSYSNVVYGSFILVFVAFFTRYILDMNWQVVFSTSIAYATLLSSTVAQYLPKLFPGNDTKTEIMQKLIDGVTHKALQSLNVGHSLVTQTVIATESDSILQSNLGNEFYNMLQSKYKEQDFALASMGTYQWKQSWWSKEVIYSALIIEVYPINESKRYEFCQILAENKGVYELGDKGLIYQAAYPKQ